MRLNKYIAQAGICSRRKADELTLAGNVKINGAVMKEPGYDVKDGDIVCVNGRNIEAPESLAYYVLNKPAGYVTTLSDEEGRPTVTDLLTDVTVRVYPVGRLDMMTRGLLILTNDGNLAQTLMHPSHEVEKIYLATINGVPNRIEQDKLRRGVMVDGRKTKPAVIEVVKEAGNQSVVEVKIHEGRNRQVRKMFEAVGYRVLDLQRIAEGEIRLGRLKEGGYRKLTPQELQYLRNL